MADLVLLEMTDEMPPQIRRQLGNFGPRFLNPAFAKKFLTCSDRLAHPACFMRFRHSYQLDVIQRPTCSLSSCRHLVANAFEIFCDGGHTPSVRIRGSAAIISGRVGILPAVAGVSPN